MPAVSLFIKLLVATLAIGECTAAVFDLKNSSMVLQRTSPATRPCVFMGREISSSEYLVGSPGIPSSIFTECHDGVLTCHQEPVGGSLNSSVVVDVACPSRVPERRLGVFGSPEDVCMLHGKRIKGRQYLHGARPGTPGSYVAVCYEKTIGGVKVALLMCFRDSGIHNDGPRGARHVRRPMHVVKCKKVPEVARKRIKRATRRLGVWDPRAPDLWPKRVVCYVLARKGSGLPADHFSKEEDAAYDKHMQDFLKNHLQKEFDAFKQGAGIQFIPFDECEQKTKGEACYNCQHAVVIDAPLDSDECTSAVGFTADYEIMNDEDPDDQHEKINHRVQSTKTPKWMQLVVLGSAKRDDKDLRGLPFGHLPRSIAHELGHTVGLVHDHQLPDRKDHGVIFDLDAIDEYSDLLTDTWFQTNLREHAEANLDTAHAEELAESLERIASAIEAMTGQVLEKQIGYSLFDSPMGGAYDVTSVMHYTHKSGVCIRKDDPDMNLLDLCDYGENHLESETGCTPGTSEHCDEAKTKAAWPQESFHKGATEEDLKRIKELYADIEPLSTEQANPNKRAKVEGS